MKINFGHKVVIGLSAFMIYILFLVYKTTTIKSDLIADDYYAQEVAFGARMEQVANYNQSSIEVSVTVQESYVEVRFTGIGESELQGEIKVIRLSDKELDFKQSFQLNETGRFLMPKSDFTNGFYTIQIEWEKDRKAYFCEHKIYV